MDDGEQVMKDNFNISQLDNKIFSLNIDKLEKEYIDIAIQLSSKREKISGILSSLIEDSLKELNMSGANFEIEISGVKFIIFF